MLISHPKFPEKFHLSEDEERDPREWVISSLFARGLIHATAVRQTFITTPSKLLYLSCRPFALRERCPCWALKWRPDRAGTVPMACQWESTWVTGYNRQRRYSIPAAGGTTAQPSWHIRGSERCKHARVGSCVPAFAPAFCCAALFPCVPALPFRVIVGEPPDEASFTNQDHKKSRIICTHMARELSAQEHCTQARPSENYPHGLSKHLPTYHHRVNPPAAAALAKGRPCES